MKSIIQTLSVISSIALVALGVLVLLVPTSALLIRAMVITGFVAAVSTLVLVECWRRDEAEYEKRLKAKDRRRRLSTHV